MPPYPGEQWKMDVLLVTSSELGVARGYSRAGLKSISLSLR